MHNQRTESRTSYNILKSPRLNISTQTDNRRYRPPCSQPFQQTSTTHGSSPMQVALRTSPDTTICKKRCEFCAAVFIDTLRHWRRTSGTYPTSTPISWKASEHDRNSGWTETYFQGFVVLRLIRGAGWLGRWCGWCHGQAREVHPWYRAEKCVTASVKLSRVQVRDFSIVRIHVPTEIGKSDKTKTRGVFCHYQ